MSESQQLQQQEELHSTRQKVVRKIDNFLANSYNLSVSTGSEVCAIVLYDESLHHYCSEAFESLINEEAGRKIIAKLLLKEDKKKKAQESSPKPTVSEPPLGPIEAEVDTEASEFIENVEEREKHFKTQVAIVLKQAEDLSLLKRPSHGCEVCFLVATPAKKIVSWSTPKLEPLYKSEQGQNYLKAVLTSTLSPPPPPPQQTAENPKEASEPKKD